MTFGKKRRRNIKFRWEGLLFTWSYPPCNNGYSRDLGRDQPIDRSQDRPRRKFPIATSRMTSVSLSLMPPMVTQRGQRGRRVGGPRAGAPAQRRYHSFFSCLVSARPLASFHHFANGSPAHRWVTQCLQFLRFSSYATILVNKSRS